MAVSALQRVCGTTIEVSESNYNALVRQSEQLRILKNFVALEEVIVKSQIVEVIKAMEEQTNE